MTPTVKPPTPELLRTCDVLDGLVGSVIAAIVRTRPEFGTWEAAVEASLLLRSLVRHTEGVITLARADLVLLPAALVLARATFETGVRVRWLLFPDGESDREARWLAHLEEEERLWGRLAELAERTGSVVPNYGRTEQAIREFRLAVRDRLPADTVVPPGIPSLPIALREQTDERRYIAYALLSQFVHGGHYSGTIWRQGLGTLKEFSEHITPSQWGLTLRISWWSLFQSAARFLQIACDAQAQLAEAEQVSLLERLLDDLEGEGVGAA